MPKVSSGNMNKNIPVVGQQTIPTYCHYVWWRLLPPIHLCRPHKPARAVPIPAPTLVPPPPRDPQMHATQPRLASVSRRPPQPFAAPTRCRVAPAVRRRHTAGPMCRFQRGIYVSTHVVCLNTLVSHFLGDMGDRDNNKKYKYGG